MMGLSQLKSVSRIRSVVGLRCCSAGKRSLRPRHWPEIILSSEVNDLDLFPLPTINSRSDYGSKNGRIASSMASVDASYGKDVKTKSSYEIF